MKTLHPAMFTRMPCECHVSICTAPKAPVGTPPLAPCPAPDAFVLHQRLFHCTRGTCTASGNFHLHQMLLYCCISDPCTASEAIVLLQEPLHCTGGSCTASSKLALRKKLDHGSEWVSTATHAKLCVMEGKGTPWGAAGILAAGCELLTPDLEDVTPSHCCSRCRRTAPELGLPRPARRTCTFRISLLQHIPCHFATCTSQLTVLHAHLMSLCNTHNPRHAQSTSLCYMHNLYRLAACNKAPHHSRTDRR